MGLEGNVELVLEKNNIYKGSDYEIVHNYEMPRIYVIGHPQHPMTRHELRDIIYDVLEAEGDFNPKKLGKYWIELNPVTDVLYLRRVSYGMKSTPKEDREYKIMGIDSPVGNIEEWKSFAREHNIKKLVFLEQDSGSTIIKI